MSSATPPDIRNSAKDSPSTARPTSSCRPVPPRCGSGCSDNDATSANYRNGSNACVDGVPGRDDTKLTTLFPAFPGTRGDSTFRIDLLFSDESKRELTTRQLRPIKDADTEADRTRVAAALIAGEVHALVENASVDVVLIARPPGIPDGVAAGSTVRLNFHDVLEAKCISAAVPIQLIRPLSWRGGLGVEHEASRAWNLMTARSTTNAAVSRGVSPGHATIAAAASSASRSPEASATTSFIHPSLRCSTSSATALWSVVA